MIKGFQGIMPDIDESAFVAESAEEVIYMKCSIKNIGILQ